MEILGTESEKHNTHPRSNFLPEQRYVCKTQLLQSVSDERIQVSLKARRWRSWISLGCLFVLETERVSDASTEEKEAEEGEQWCETPNVMREKRIAGIVFVLVWGKKS